MLENRIKKDLRKQLNLSEFGKPYRSPKNYGSWQDEIAVYYLKSFDPYSKDKISNYAINVSKSLINYNFPTYYVSRELTLALWNTLSDLKVEDLTIAKPTAQFMFPYETIITPENHSLTSVGIASTRKCENLKYIYDCYGDGLIGASGFITNNLDNSYWYGTFNKKAQIPETEQSYEEYLLENDMIPVYMEDETEKSFMNKFRSFIFNLMFILEKRPELITEERIKQKGFGNNKKTSNYRNPIWVGKDYKIQYKYVDKKESEKDGKPKSPHFRKGHLRRQRFGKNREEVKIIWVDPVIVNAKK